ncbi:MAG TPA: hypothetical protein VMY05_11390 [Acidobacteriota bacterium]|nr:hypothetical protein [Acidobacteriota bacterium]
MSIRVVLVLLAAVSCLSGPVRGTPQQIIVYVEPAPLAWGESRLAESLDRHLTRSAELRVRLASCGDDQTPPFPSARFDPDSLLDWGREIGGRYLLLVVVHSERLQTDKTFSVPLVVHQWERVGVIEGEVRLLDLQRGRVLLAESFDERHRARRLIQGDPDNSYADPGLHVPASAKQALFGELENKLAERLVGKIKGMVRSR